MTASHPVPRELTIGELAGRFGLATHVLRHWEETGVLVPARRVGGQRRYAPGQVMDVAMILLGKESGFSLEEIRRLGDEPDRGERRRILLRQRSALRQRIAAATVSLDLVEHALRCDAEDFRDCPEFLGKLAARLPRGAGEPPAG
ncbi:MerR family transcriptional regulator [Streptomyces aidingensis]|uniref:DNA-binding transcriptional regulator, MerR family n=1 Tax=Streptomyces aidingensis TaxID=910347 RepID=A0A1I1N752_9ACTN|nr:MerR family transcriptional regulator [Streptomyces aidingensis]SFC89570.1 DNA-binding transcriptional regulator, MerR family [Streptomyces aidingensis]